MHPYSFQHVQAFNPGDDILRIKLREFTIVKFQEDSQFLDEAKFSREGITNKRKQHFWVE